MGWVPQSDKSWLADLVQEALNKALDNSDYYTPMELSFLWQVGVQQGVLGSDDALIGRFLEAFDTKLDEAIARDDTETILDIKAFAGRYGYKDLYSKAAEALAGGAG